MNRDGRWEWGIKARESESDFTEDVKIVWVSRCYFETRPLVLKIKSVQWRCKMYTCSLSSKCAASHHMCDVLSSVLGWISHFPITPLALKTQLPWNNWNLVSKMSYVSLSIDQLILNSPSFPLSPILCWLFCQVLFDFVSLCLPTVPSVTAPKSLFFF